jgi:hypothetical protein
MSHIGGFESDKLSRLNGFLSITSDLCDIKYILYLTAGGFSSFKRIEIPLSILIINFVMC